MRIIGTIFICFFLTGKAFGQPADSNLKISHLTGDFYVFTTYNYYKGSRIPANGLYLLTNQGAVMIDSPWDTTQFQPLLDSIRVRHKKTVVMCIATHFHEDRTGGLEYYKQQGIKTYTTRQTDELSKKKGMKRAEFILEKDSLFTVGEYSFQTYDPGHGHAPDNIVVWFEKERILYGGCLIKSVEDKTLGNLSDASVTDYPTTINNVLEKCKNPNYVIPGHNGWATIRSLKHTLKMAQKLYKKIVNNKRYQPGPLHPGVRHTTKNWLATPLYMDKRNQFWEWFKNNNKAYLFLNSVDEEVKEELLESMLTELHKYCDNIYFEIGGFPDEDQELIITAEGDKKYFDAVEKLIAAAPKIDGWVFIAFKPAMPEHFKTEWDNLELDTQEMYFKPVTNDDDPEIGIRIFLKNHDLIKDNETLTPLLYKMLDTILGEKSFALDIDHVDTDLLPDDPEEEEMFPILELPNYIGWNKSQPKKSSN